MNKLSEFIISGGIDLKNLYPDDFRELTKSVFLKKIKKEFSNLGEDFKLEKQAGIYKNSFIGISSDFVIIFYIRDKNLLFSLLKKDSFIPNTIKDYAMIHATHHSSANKEPSIFFIYRELKMPIDSDFKAFLFYQRKFKKIKKDRKLIIIENQKIFNLYDLKKFLERSFCIPKISNDDIVMLGSGNKISSKLIHPKFYESFSEVLYFGDYDDEGLAIYNRIDFGLASTSFCLPKREIVLNIQSEMEKYSKGINKSNYSDRPLNGLLLDSSEIKKLFNKIIDIKYEMQQEVFLF